jgi:hypothetical protein
MKLEEYREKRLKDGSFTTKEMSFFRQVMPLIETKEDCESFSKTWA